LPRRRGDRLEAKDTTALVYVDASGNLHERLLDLDKYSDTYKYYQRELQWER
jgi:hypothetical protein